MKTSILWADDEIELLKPHILFLEEKGCEVVGVQSGRDALDVLEEQQPDIVFLDEQMPGLSGIDTLGRIKERWPQLPVVMITKSEEEGVMEDALGGKISDYLIKPVNPNQIWLTVKKHTELKRLQSEHSTMNYQQQFREIGMQLQGLMDANEWMEVYKRLVYWELELSGTEDDNIHDIFLSQKKEANQQFCRFYERNYVDWLGGSVEKPLLSPTVLQERMFPLLKEDKPTFLIVIDNFRYDQWKMLEQELASDFTIDEDLYCSILPTATQYARNAIFSGLMPDQIAKMFPDLWVDEDEEEGKNLNEEPLIQTQLERYRRKNTFSYYKINTSQDADRFMQQLNTLDKNDLNVVVFNFIDMLSHARTESKMVRELANNESAYRSITLSWFRHSVIADLFRQLAQTDYRVIITTDHGSIRANNPVKIVGDRNTNTNLRYKLGKNLSYDSKDIFIIKEPRKAMLPMPNLSTSYVFATGDDFFAYPNNYNYYVSYYRNTFQHGGISMEEMLIPIVTMKRKR